MRCLDCSHMTSGDGYSSQKMARHGFSLCDRERSKAHYRSLTWDRDCGKFQKAAAEEIEKRINWLEKRNGKDSE